jgi:hypothetical protein
VLGFFIIPLGKGSATKPSGKMKKFMKIKVFIFLLLFNLSGISQAANSFDYVGQWHNSIIDDIAKSRSSFGKDRLFWIITATQLVSESVCNRKLFVTKQPEDINLCLSNQMSYQIKTISQYPSTLIDETYQDDTFINDAINNGNKFTPAQRGLLTQIIKLMPNDLSKFSISNSISLLDEIDKKIKLLPATERPILFIVSSVAKNSMQYWFKQSSYPQESVWLNSSSPWLIDSLGNPIIYALCSSCIAKADAKGAIVGYGATHTWQGALVGASAYSTAEIIRELGW